jgi:hypothetical protein
VATNISSFRASLGEPFTFSLLFVRNYGDEPAVLDDVELVGASSGIRLVGTRAADITGDRRTWSGDDVFPPHRPPDQLPLSAFEIAGDAAQDAQLILGVEMTEEGQHGFEGVAVLYHAGDDRYRYVIPSGAVACSESYFEERDRKTCNPDDLFGGR